MSEKVDFQTSYFMIVTDEIDTPIDPFYLSTCHNCVLTYWKVAANVETVKKIKEKNLWT